MGVGSRQPLEKEVPEIPGPDVEDVGANPGSDPNFQCDHLSL